MGLRTDLDGVTETTQTTAADLYDNFGEYTAKYDAVLKGFREEVTEKANESNSRIAGSERQATANEERIVFLAQEFAETKKVDDEQSDKIAGLEDEM